MLIICLTVNTYDSIIENAEVVLFSLVQLIYRMSTFTVNQLSPHNSGAVEVSPLYPYYLSVDSTCKTLSNNQ
jgi:hypothetical protein